MNAIQNFLELIWSLHVIVYAVFFLNFKTENLGWFVITLMNAMYFFFLGFRLKKKNQFGV